MIAVDSNLLIYAHMTHSPWNERAYKTMSNLVASGTRWAIPAQCLSEFFAIATNPRVYKPASTPTEALRQIDSWLGSPSLAVLGEDAATWAIQKELIVTAKLVGPAVHDARIAAVCLQHDVAELWTHDRDFSRFPGLRTRSPLVDPLPGRVGEGRVRYRAERRGRPPGRSTVATR